MIFTVPSGKTYGQTTGEFGKVVARIRTEIAKYQPLRMVEATSAWFHHGELFSIYKRRRIIRLFDLSRINENGYNFKSKGIGVHYTAEDPATSAEYEYHEIDKLIADIHTLLTKHKYQTKPGDEVLFTHYPNDGFEFPIHIHATVQKVLETGVEITFKNGKGETTTHTTEAINLQAITESAT